MFKPKFARICVAVILCATCGFAFAQEEADKPKVDSAKQLELIDIVKQATVTVQYKLKYDQGQSPDYYYPYSSGYHDYTTFCVCDDSPDTCIDQQRSFDVAGIAISKTEFIIPDLSIHERFIESISIKTADGEINARVMAICSDRPAILLHSEKEIESVKPLDFSAAGDDDLFSVVIVEKDGVWSYGIAAWSKAVTVGVNGPKVKAPPMYSVVLDTDGKAATINCKGYYDVEERFYGSPKSWPFVSAERLTELRASVQGVFASSIMRVRLDLRSPKKDQSAMSRYSYRSEDESTEMHVLGAKLDEKRILVTADLQPKVTARLEHITVFPVDSEPVEAKFVSSLKDYGCFIAELDSPVGQNISVSDKKLSELFLDMLIGVEVTVQGENVDVKTTHRRIMTQYKDFKGHMAPGLEGSDSFLLLYDIDGSLVALPSVRRVQDSDDYRYRDYGRGSEFIAAGELEEVLYSDDLASFIDAGNVPLSEELELRLAWLGVELQPLDRELARINKVSSITDDGEFGCLVSYVYPDSPAKKAGIKLGDVLISMKSDKWPQPKNVTLENYVDPSYFMQLWEQFDEIPEEYFERIPRPWPAAENVITRALTDLGFGEQFELEYARRGQEMNQSFTVEQSPAHYDMAKRFKSEPLGMTVRDLSYEVRRYFQRKSDQPGIIVSKVEPGSRASVSGVKPFEIITHVNNEPVFTSEQFKAAAESGEDLVLQIKRMTKGRVVSIRAQ